jgi:hypothetical protein
MLMPKHPLCRFCLALSVLVCSFPARSAAPPPQTADSSATQSPAADASPSNQSAATQQSDNSSSGSVTGTVVDPSGAAVAGARVRLTRKSPAILQEVQTDGAGQFSFVNIPAGLFQLAITLPGFAAQFSSGVLQSGDNYQVPQIALAIATATAEVEVTPTRVEVAEDQIKVEEKQRVLGVIPNFYVTYDHHAVPLTSRQKFELAWKTTIDPVNFGITGVIAGVQQADDDFSGYGQGTAGYARRYGAAYGNFVTGAYIGSAILPSLLKQDPRYFYKGTGTTRSRILYAVANAVICKGDNGHWEPNYSAIIGSLASGGISNLYYPAKNRDGATLTFENALIGVGAAAAANILQEFFIRKLTPRASPANHAAAKLQSAIEDLAAIPLHAGD